MKTPHDTLFHFTFRWARHSRSWFRSILSAAIVAAVDWNNLIPAPEKVHGTQLRLHVTDILFAAPMAPHPRQVFFVPEHKSYDDPNLGTQLLGYAVHIGGGARLSRDDPPALVIAVVLYHGDKPFRSPRPCHPHLADLDPAAATALAALQPGLGFVVDDLSVVTEASIRARDLTALATLTMLCLRFLRYCSPADALASLQRWAAVLRAVDRDEQGPPGCDAIATVGWYVLSVTEVTALALHEMFERILERPEETIMSTAERLRLEGEVRGEVRGEARGRLAHSRDTLCRLLTKRFGPPSPELAQRIATADLEALDRWTERILDADSLLAVFADD